MYSRSLESGIAECGVREFTLEVGMYLSAIVFRILGLQIAESGVRERIRELGMYLSATIVYLNADLYYRILSMYIKS